MQILFLFVVFFCSVTVLGQTDHISDPGLTSLAANQCDPDAPWWFRADYIWNNTDQYLDAQCQAFLELPTAARSGLTKGNETNINKFTIPALPRVHGGDPEWPASAGVVDMNSPCRCALWAPFELMNDSSTVDISLDIWATLSNPSIEQFFIPDSQVPNATLLQYLSVPDGLLDTSADFPFPSDVTNQIRIDIILPDSNGDFYDRAFSLFPDQIAASFEIPNWGDDDAIPASGTQQSWWTVTGSTTDLKTAGKYALRISGAHSLIGAAWGISDVHLIESNGVPPENTTVTSYPWDMLIDNAEQTVGGTLTVSKLALLTKKQGFRK